jgi:hypothetical protein
MVSKVSVRENYYFFFVIRTAILRCDNSLYSTRSPVSCVSVDVTWDIRSDLIPSSDSCCILEATGTWRHKTRGTKCYVAIRLGDAAPRGDASFVLFLSC